MAAIVRPSLTAAEAVTLIEVLGRWEWSGQLDDLPYADGAQGAEKLALERLMLALREVAWPESEYSEAVRVAWKAMLGSGG